MKIFVRSPLLSIFTALWIEKRNHGIMLQVVSETQLCFSSYLYRTGIIKNN